MNKTELVIYLRKSEQLSYNQIDDLERIVNQYPYFLSVRILLAKASKDHQHPKMKRYLASASMYSTDRILLKKYLNGNLFFLHKSDNPEVTTIPEKQKNWEKNSLNTPNTLESRNKSRIPDLPSDHLDTLLEELQRDMENLKSSREKFAIVQQKIVDDDTSTASENVSPSNLDSEHLKKKIEESRDKNQIAIPTQEIAEQVLEAARKAKEEVAKEDEETAKGEDQSKKKNSSETKIPDNLVIKSNIKRQETENTKTSYNPTASGIGSEEETISEITGEKISDKFKNTKENQEEKNDDNTSSKSQQDIIDKFIKKSSKIKNQQDKENHTIGDLSEQSSSWDSNLVSEHLAEIYLRQGNKSRAIEIYVALMLKYPEKKSYFVDLISKLT